MPFTEDLTVFFDVNEFATAAVYSGSGATVNGIFDNDYYEPMGRVQASSPVFVCRTADVPSAAHGETITLGAIAYRIVGVEHGGTGVTLLRLEKP